MQPRSHRRPIPLWQIAPFCLLPATFVAAASYYVQLSSQVVLYTFLLSCTGLLLIAAPHKPLRQVLAVAMLVLGFFLALNGDNTMGLVAAAVR
jgi:hypothetical protein